MDLDKKINDLENKILELVEEYTNIRHKKADYIQVPQKPYS